LDSEEIEDTKGVIGMRKSKNKQHNGQKEKDKRNKQRSQNTTQKTKDRVTRTPLKPEGEIKCSGGVSSSCFTSDTRRVNLVTKYQFLMVLQLR